MLIQILNFDLLPTEYVYSALDLNFIPYLDFVDVNDVSSVLTMQMQDMGFQTFNPILNLGGIFLLFLFYFVEVLIVLCLMAIVYSLFYLRERQKARALMANNKIPKARKFKWVIKKIGKFYDMLRGSLVFNQLLAIVFESVFHLTMATILNFSQYGFDLGTEEV